MVVTFVIIFKNNLVPKWWSTKLDEVLFNLLFLLLLQFESI